MTVRIRSAVPLLLLTLILIPSPSLCDDSESATSLAQKALAAAKRPGAATDDVLRILAAAEKALAKLRRDTPDSPEIDPASRLLAEAYLTSADRAREIRLDRLRKAANHLALHLWRKKCPTIDDFEKLAGLHEELGDRRVAESCLREALRILNGELDNSQSTTGRRTALKARSAGILQRIRALRDPGDAVAMRDLCEGLLIRSRDDRDRVLELLDQQEHSQAELKELGSAIRFVPSTMVGLALAYQELGSRTELLRALTLLRLLSALDRSQKYTDPWWEWQATTFEIWLELFTAHGIEQARANIMAKYRNYDGLGVLERSRVKERMKRVLKWVR